MYDPMNIYYDIVKSDLILPFNTEKNFSEFITKILNKDPKCRLSSLNSAKNEKFFYCFNWDDIIDMKMDPPFIPTNKYQIKECLNNKEKKYTDMVKHFEMTSLSLSSSLKDNISNNSLWADEF
jgi:serine/threonine protein kinase